MPISYLTILSNARAFLVAGNILNLLTLILFTSLLTHNLISTRRRTSNPSTSGFRLLYLCLTLLSVRALYRAAAYSCGLIDRSNKDPKTSPLKLHPLFMEWWGYGFDAFAVFVLLVCVAAWYPAHKILDVDETDGSGSGATRGYDPAQHRRQQFMEAPWFGNKARGGGGGASTRGSNIRMQGFPRA